jgi:hypothetical protein
MNKYKDLKVGDVLESGINGWELVVLEIFSWGCIAEDQEIVLGVPSNPKLYSFKELERTSKYEIVKPEWRADVEGQEYWYADYDGCWDTVWRGDKRDKFKLKLGLCFETEELAEEHYKKVMES